LVDLTSASINFLVSWNLHN